MSVNGGQLGTSVAGGAATGAGIGAAFGGIGAPIGAAAGALLGAGKYFLVDQPDEEKKQRIRAAQALAGRAELNSGYMPRQENIWGTLSTGAGSVAQQQANAKQAEQQNSWNQQLLDIMKNQNSKGGVSSLQAGPYQNQYTSSVSPGGLPPGYSID